MRTLKSKIFVTLAATTGIAAAESTTCDSSIAYPIDNFSTQSPPPSGYTGGTGSTGVSGTTGTSNCDAACQAYIVNQQLQTSQQLSSIWASTGANVVGLAKNRVKRGTSTQSLACSSTELCLSLEGVAFCINPDTYDFRDVYGGQGNVLTGTYVVPSSVAAVSGVSYKAGATITGLSGSQPTGSSKGKSGGVASMGSASDAVTYFGGMIGLVWFLYSLL
jgi:hypothetical protein